jgi:hypothetical protein
MAGTDAIYTGSCTAGNYIGLTTTCTDAARTAATTRGRAVHVDPMTHETHVETAWHLSLETAMWYTAFNFCFRI